MSNKEQFLAFVFVGAIAQDFLNDSTDTPLVMHIARQIPEERLPEDVMEAARVFLSFCSGVRKRPVGWMLARS
jgi:hypothetical protein